MEWLVLIGLLLIGAGSIFILTRAWEWALGGALIGLIVFFLWGDDLASRIKDIDKDGPKASAPASPSLNTGGTQTLQEQAIKACMDNKGWTRDQCIAAGQQAGIVPGSPGGGTAPVVPVQTGGASPQGDTNLGGITWHHAGGNMYSPASTGCVTVPSLGRLDTPNGVYYAGETYMVTGPATLYLNAGPATVNNPRKTCQGTTQGTSVATGSPASTQQATGGTTTEGKTVVDRSPQGLLKAVADANPGFDVSRYIKTDAAANGGAQFTGPAVSFTVPAGMMVDSNSSSTRKLQGDRVENATIFTLYAA